MKNNRLIIIGVLSLCVVDPIILSQPSNSPISAEGGIAIGVISSLLTGIITWAATSHSYTSEAAQKEKEEEEKKLVKAAAAALDHIKRQAHSVLKKEGQLALEDVAILEGAELVKVEGQVDEFLTNVREHKSHLNKVTGRYNRDNKNPDYYQEAHTVFIEMGNCESLLTHCKNLLGKVNNLREKPLRNVQYISPLVNKLKSHSKSTILAWVEREYSASTTKDGIRGLPFVCAVEHIGARHKELNDIIYHLELYQSSLSRVDQVIGAKLKKLYEDRQLLEESAQSLANTNKYAEQIQKNEIASNERRRVVTELHATKAERAKKEAELREAKNKAQALENERARNAIAAQQAATNLVNSVGSAVSAAAQHASDEADEALGKARREIARLERKNSKLRNRIKELERQLRQYNMPQPSAPSATTVQHTQKEGWCIVHNCYSNRCPDTACKW